MLFLLQSMVAQGVLALADIFDLGSLALPSFASPTAVRLGCLTARCAPQSPLVLPWCFTAGELVLLHSPNVQFPKCVQKSLNHTTLSKETPLILNETSSAHCTSIAEGHALAQISCGIRYKKLSDTAVLRRHFDREGNNVRIPQSKAADKL
jgi:hypothetical protein